MKNKETKVVNVRFESYDVYIGRPSKWGNIFMIGQDGTREQVVKKYENWIRNKPKLMKELSELKGKRLGCYCSPRLCHGDVLIKILEELDETDK